MTGSEFQVDSTVGHITVRYWAAARAAAGLAEELVPVSEATSLAEILARLGADPDRPELARSLRRCSVLVGDRPVSSGDPTAVTVGPGDVVEFLPPFAGG